MRTGISVMIIGLGPAILAAVTVASLLRGRSKRSRGSGDARKARIIVAAAFLSTVLVTIGVLITRR